MRDTLILNSVFKNHAKSANLLNWITERGLVRFRGAFPNKYFEYSHSTMIQISQSDRVGHGLLYKVSFSSNEFLNNRNFQKLGFGSQAYYRGSLISLRSDDQVVNTMLVFKLNIVLSNKAIGPETSLIYIQGYKYVQI